MGGPQVVVVGGVAVDTVLAVPWLPGAGQTVTAVAARRACGGKARNQAVAAARHGASVAVVARVGDDDDAGVVVHDLVAAGIDVTHVRPTAGVRTASYVSLAADGGDALAAWQPGANRALSAGDVAAAGVVATARYVICQLEVPDDAVDAAIERATGHVILDAGPAPERARAFVPRVWLVHANAHEAEVLTGVRVDDEASARRSADVILGQGATWASVSAGGEGELLASPDETWWVPASGVRVVDTVGAGDALVGVLVAALAGDASPRDAAAAGAAAAAAGVQVLGPP